MHIAIASQLVHSRQDPRVPYKTELVSCIINQLNHDIQLYSYIYTVFKCSQLAIVTQIVAHPLQLATLNKHSQLLHHIGPFKHINLKSAPNLSYIDSYSQLAVQGCAPCFKDLSANQLARYRILAPPLSKFQRSMHASHISVW